MVPECSYCENQCMQPRPRLYRKTRRAIASPSCRLGTWLCATEEHRWPSGGQRRHTVWLVPSLVVSVWQCSQSWWEEPWLCFVSVRGGCEAQRHNCPAKAKRSRLLFCTEKMNSNFATLKVFSPDTHQTFTPSLWSFAHRNNPPKIAPWKKNEASWGKKLPVCCHQKDTTCIRSLVHSEPHLAV